MKPGVIIAITLGGLFIFTETKSVYPANRSKRWKRTPWKSTDVEKRDELLKALNVLERQRRRYEDPDEFLNPMGYNVFKDGLAAGFERPDEDDAALYPSSARAADEHGPVFNLPKKPHYRSNSIYPKPADMKELANILASDTKANEKKADWGSSEESDLDQNYINLAPESGNDLTSEEIDDEMPKLTRKQLEMLLEKAEDFEKKQMEKGKHMNKKEQSDIRSKKEGDGVEGDSAETESEEKAPVTVEPVSKEELEEVLKGDDVASNEGGGDDESGPGDDDDDNDNEALDTNTQSMEEGDDWPKFATKMAEINKEWLIKQYLKAAGEELSKKRKRGGTSMSYHLPYIDAPEEEEELEEEEAEDEKKEEEKQQNSVKRSARDNSEDLLGLLERYDIENKLISRENEFLASALNAATLGQIENTDRYLGPQYDALQKAVEIEEAVQELSDGLDSEPDDDDDENSAMLDRKRFAKKSDVEKSQSKMAENEISIEPSRLGQLSDTEEEADEGQWFDRPLPEGYELIDQSNPDATGINPFLRKLVGAYEPEMENEVTSKRNDVDDKVDEDDDEDLPSDDEIAEAIEQLDEEDDLEAENEKNEIASALMSLRKNTLASPDEEIPEIRKEPCPALRIAAENCQDIMRKYNVDLDQEARGACTRHRLCYACGSSFKSSAFSPVVCDNIFLHEVERRCQGEDACKEGAMGLFFLMLRTHKYQLDSSKSCQDMCNMDTMRRLIFNID